MFNIFDLEKIFFIIFFFLFVLFVLRGNGNFATNKDRANVLFAYDSGITSYGTQQQAHLRKNAVKINKNIWKWINYDVNYKNEKNSFLLNVLDEAEKQNIVLPSDIFWEELDELVLQSAWKSYIGPTLLLNNAKNNYIITDEFTVSDIVSSLNCFGYLKFFSYKMGDDSVFECFDKFNAILKRKLGIEKCPNVDFVNLYKQKLLLLFRRHTAFVNIQEKEYGDFTSNHKKIFLEPKTLDMAKKIGVIETIFVFPICVYIEKTVDYFENKNLGRILAFVLIAFLMKLMLLLFFLNDEINRQKRMALQSKVKAINEKYANFKDETFKKRFVEYEKKMLYNKYGINFSIIGNILQILIFFIFFRSIQNSAVMSEPLFHLYLNDSLFKVIFNVTNLRHFIIHFDNKNGYLAAIILLCLRAVTQVITLKLPDFIKRSYTDDNDTASNKKHFLYFLILLSIIFIPIIINLCFMLITIFNTIQMLIIYCIYKNKIIEECKK
ncbi:MAG: YidC/Oxa1 family membrane protein insertase [Bacilli bacterium]|nr:YidC/Oxa1 family membrane protein insertase [Bacilli bacterium]